MITQQLLWLSGLNTERPGAFKPVVPGTGGVPRASILKALRGAGLTTGSAWRKPAGTVWMAWLPAFGHADAVWQSVVQDMVQRIALLPYYSALLLRANTFGGR